MRKSISYCVPAFFLTIFLVYSIFYAPIVFKAFKKNTTRSRYYYITAGFCLGLLAAVIPATDYNYEAGRFSGFWNFVRLAPDIGHTSILLLITSSLGGAAFLSWLLLLKKRVAINDCFVFTGLCTGPHPQCAGPGEIFRRFCVHSYLYNTV